jgi:type IV secretion system protein VirD4
VLFMVDETAHIGKMEALEAAVTLLRGAGVRLWLFFQSIDQLNKCFGENAATVMDNLGTQQYFGINSYETAETLSKRIGKETVVVRTEGGNDGSSRSSGGGSQNQSSTNSGTSETTAEAERLLLMPDEILTLRDDVGLVFHKNNYVILSQQIRWYADKAFRRRWWRGYGTGRTRGLGLGGAVLALAALLLSGGVTVLVASLPVPVRQPPGGWAGANFNSQPAGMAGEGFRGTGPLPGVEPWRQPPQLQPLPYGPDVPPYGLSPYRRGRRSYP